MGSEHQTIISFTPMFCVRSSTKDISTKCYVDGPLSNRHKPSVSIFEDPTSPRVSCMGQIKGDSKVSLSSAKGNKFHKLKRMLSGKSFGREFSAKINVGDHSIINIVDLDPPLPVPPLRLANDCDGVSLWKRRCGQPLDNLLIQRPHCGQSRRSI